MIPQVPHWYPLGESIRMPHNIVYSWNKCANGHRIERINGQSAPEREERDEQKKAGRPLGNAGT